MCMRLKVNFYLKFKFWITKLEYQKHLKFPTSWLDLVVAAQVMINPIRVRSGGFECFQKAPWKDPKDIHPSTNNFVCKCWTEH